MSGTNPLVASGTPVASFAGTVTRRKTRATVTAGGDTVTLSAHGAQVLALLLSASAEDVREVEELLEAHREDRAGVTSMLSPEEAAALLGVSRPTVVRWAADGLLEDHPVGSHHRFVRADVVALRERRLRDARAAREEAVQRRAALGSELDTPPTRAELTAAALAARSGDTTALNSVMERQRRADARAAAQAAAASS